MPAAAPAAFQPLERGFAIGGIAPVTTYGPIAMALSHTGVLAAIGLRHL